MLFIVGVIISWVKLFLLGMAADIISGVNEVIGKKKDGHILPQYQSSSQYMKFNIVELDRMKQDLTNVLKGSQTRAPNIKVSRKVQKSIRPKLAQPSKIQWILPFCEAKLGDFRLLNKKIETEQNSEMFYRIEEKVAKFSRRNSMLSRMAKRKYPRFVSTRLTVIYEGVEYR